ncbi:hypothetical protein EBB59_06710 [Lysobacter pythonis]|uniref:Uncharacterized protein n=1 Tax=Solilutibacter pythonis TaxID=2483112 RepID=A0A3M2HY95_9GAMM|nr:hypothetical protein [Lysobacter pythonis]RMH93215.1 hypothetical protein EBB59_06710 [Lysobacter pythonis]
MRKMPLSLALLLAACGSPPPQRRWLDRTGHAVRAANEDPTHGIRGHFVLMVRSIGQRHDLGYLNSETDYRHQTNLTIAMKTATMRQVAKRLGVEPGQLRGRRLVVLGQAQRMRIAFIDGQGRPTGKYYCQTHVRVEHPTLVEFAPD